MTTTLPRASKKGFELDGSRAQILLLHGYTGSPYDLRPLADFLHAHDVKVSVPLLRGHGNKPSDLNRVSATQWLEDATRALSTFDKKKPIVVGGLSMGGLLAIILARKFPFVKGLLLFSPAFRLGVLAELTLTAANIGVINRNISFQKLSGGSDIADPVAKRKTPAYKEMPLSGLVEFDKLRVLATRDLQRISCPVFLGFGRLDSAINAFSSHRIAMGALHSKNIVDKFYDQSKHVITLDYDRDAVFVDTWQFLQRHIGI